MSLRSSALALAALSCHGQLVTSGLLSEWRFSDGSGTTLTDSAGSCPGTLTNSGGSGTPSWVTGGLSFNSDNRHVVSLSSGCFSSAITIQIFAYIDPLAPSTGIAPIFGYSSGVGGLQMQTKDYSGYTFVSPGFGNGSGYRTAAYKSGYGPTLITAVIGSPSDTIYIDGSAVSQYYTRGSSSSVAKNGGIVFGASTGTGQGGFWSGTLYYAAIYDRALSGAEVSQNYTYMKGVIEARGVVIPTVQSSTASVLVCAGDSLAGGFGTAVTPCGSLSTALDKVVLSRPSGTATGFVESAAGWIDGQFRPSAQSNVTVIWAGTNDLAFAGGTGIKTPSQAYDEYAALCSARRAAGWKVVAVPMISRTGSTGGVNATCDASGDIFGGGVSACKNDTLKTQLNSLISANWTSFADAYADLSVNGALTGNGAYANPSAGCGGSNCFAGDAVHLTVAGYTQVGSIIQAAVESLFSSRSRMNGAVILSGGAKVN